MKYRQLLALDIRHDYYGGAACPALEIAPDPACQRLLHNLRCVVQTRTGGLRVLIPVSSQDTPFITLPEPSVFGFCLRAAQTEFFLFSDLASLQAMRAPQFANHNDAGVLTLADAAQTDVASPASALATIELTLPNPQAALTDTSHAFVVPFAAKNYRWKYYVVTSQSGQASIDGRDIRFDTSDLSRTPDNNDALALGLAAQYPGQHIWRMRSQAPLACQQPPRSALALLFDAEKVWSDLPNPALQNFVSDVENATTQDAQDALYHIVKY
jgi:hypothetical protein